MPQQLTRVRNELRSGVAVLFLAALQVSVGIHCFLVSVDELRAQEPARIRGFLPASSLQQNRYERAFLVLPSEQKAREHLRILSEAPHVAGTPEDYQTALYVRDRFREFGLQARIVEYHVLLPMPQEVRLELLEPVRRLGPTPERDANGFSDPRVVAPFSAYSPSGDVTAEVVYANFGLPEDYVRLEKMGVDVAGKIVLVRYGRCFRGVKSLVAHQQGAAGVIIYSDPQEDGYRQGNPYPLGPWRPPSAVQRGSILNLGIYAGDPLTPGYAAIKEARRLSMEEAKTLPKIPTTPISYEDAAPILENLTGQVAPQDWQGALPFAYHVGPGASKVRLLLKMDFRVRPIWNVIAEIPGQSEPDRWVVLGNHRDAWTFGAADPLSGTVPLLEVARSLGELLRQGWHPRRTIVLASWDAEEFGLIGSTEWVEGRAGELSRKCVAYLNIDVGVAGRYFRAQATPSLAGLIREVTREVPDPNSAGSVFQAWLRDSVRLRREPGLPILVPSDSLGVVSREPSVGEMGSGSDYTPFFQHLGIPSIDIGFGGSYGVYHALQDNFLWMERFGDPGFHYSVAATKIWGLLALRLANADLLPYDYVAYGRVIQNHLHDLRDDLREAEGAERLSLDQTLAAVQQFIDSVEGFRRRWNRLSEAQLSDKALSSRINDALMKVERDFLLPGGLPGRPWYRHAFYAPGVYTGYSTVPIPGLRESVRVGDWDLAREQEEALRGALDRGRATIEDLLDFLDQGAEQVE